VAVPEVHFTRDRREHHLLDRPRDGPFRTATGVAGLSVFLVLFLAGGNDVTGVVLNVPVETISRILQVLFIAAPAVCWLATYYTCKKMRDTDAHPGRPSAGLLLRRTTSGEYQTIPAGDTGDGGGEPVVRRSASSAPRHTPPAHGMPEE
jgi:ubiquinol-cytochrome c reductase cytochrome b subunit